MSNIISLPVAAGTARPNIEALAWALDRMTAGLWAPILPGESFDDALNRREAARDILDDLLAEYAEEQMEEAAETSPVHLLIGGMTGSGKSGPLGVMAGGELR